MKDFLNAPIVLRLNANYQRLGWSTPSEAFCMLMGDEKDGVPPALALDVHYEYDEYGKPDLDGTPTFDRMEWEYWLLLEPRRGDLDKVVHTSKRIIRVPTIIICPKFYLMPKKNQRPTPQAIRRRDGNRCVYTNVELSNSTFSLDHVVPKSRGGRDTWENLVSCHRNVNARKGNMFNHEAGLKLLRRPTAPSPIPLCTFYAEIKHPDHQHF